MERSKSMTPSPPGAHAATAPDTTGSVGTGIPFAAPVACRHLAVESRAEAFGARQHVLLSGLVVCILTVRLRCRGWLIVLWKKGEQ